MILKGSQRGGARDLVRHLTRTDENEHVEVQRLRGFAAQDLVGALNEMYAVSRGTKCRQFMYSVIFNPPPDEEVTTADFEAAIAQVEKRFGLSGQPCAVVFHEKKGRRHAHAVWSRIDTDEMKAVQLSFYKNKLQSISRDLFLEHGWTMPRGLIKSEQRDPTNFTLEEWQHAKRVGKDARAIKVAIQDAWAISDSKPTFAHALRERGYWLALGDSARFVAVDHNGEAYNIARSLPPGIKTKQIRQRLGSEADLPGLSEVKKQIADDMLSTILGFQDELDQRVETRRIEFERRRQALVQRQRAERRMLAEAHERRRIEESRARQARFRKGVKGLWDRVRGEHRRIREEKRQRARMVAKPCKFVVAESNGKRRRSFLLWRMPSDRFLKRFANDRRAIWTTRHFHEDGPSKSKPTAFNCSFQFARVWKREFKFSPSGGTSLHIPSEDTF